MIVNCAVPVMFVLPLPGYVAFTVTTYGNVVNAPDCGVTTSAVPVFCSVNNPLGTCAPPGVAPTVIVQVAVAVMSTGFIWPETVADAV